MYNENILNQMSKGRTDLLFDFMKQPDWISKLNAGKVKLLQWLVYYNDTTALRAVIANGGDLSSIDLNEELGNAAFSGYWKVCDFLIEQGADVNRKNPDTAETPLHNALCKAGRPYFIYTVRLLLEQGADVNAKTKPGIETGAFMRDVRTYEESPLHRAAAYCDENTIQLLLDYGADKKVRDMNGDSPLTWASMHLRPASILALLQFGNHHIGPSHVQYYQGDHGTGWGGMDWNWTGEYIPMNKKKK